MNNIDTAVKQFEEKFVYLEDNPSYNANDVPTVRNAVNDIKEWLRSTLTKAIEEAKKEDANFLEEKGYLVAAEFIREHTASLSQQTPEEKEECKHGGCCKDDCLICQDPRFKEEAK